LKTLIEIVFFNGRKENVKFERKNTPIKKKSSIPESFFFLLSLNIAVETTKQKSGTKRGRHHLETIYQIAVLPAIALHI